MCSGTESETEKLEQEASSRRNFLKLIVTLSGVAALGTVGSLFRVLEFVPPASTGPLAWPVVKLANISSLDPTKPLRFNYPLIDTPSVLIKAGVAAQNGVGPNSDIVAFSDICQHLGCIYGVLLPGDSPPCDSSFKASSAQGYCCCHGGQYNYLQAGQVIGGPPIRPVPQVILRYDSSTGDIYAVGMSPPTIFGKGPPGITDPALVLQYDLRGGTAVTDATVFSNTG